MNSLIAEILNDPNYSDRIRRKLPAAFETVEHEAKGPEVGVLREHVIVGMLMAFIGESQVIPVRRAVHPDIDCYVGGQPLSIKTVSGSGLGGIRLKWTANAVKAQEFISSYSPHSDLLIVRIVWDRSGYILYAPLEIQQEVYQNYKGDYLDYRGATNTRGVNLSAIAENDINKHHTVLTLPVTWHRSAATGISYERWVSYWRDP